MILSAPRPTPPPVVPPHESPVELGQLNIPDLDEDFLRKSLYDATPEHLPHPSTLASYIIHPAEASDDSTSTAMSLATPTPSSPTPSTSSSSSPTSSNLPSEYASTISLDDEATSYEAAVQALGPIASRPLSTVLSSFSYRVSTRMSTFQDLDEDDDYLPGDVIDHAREPTMKEELFIQKAMESEVKAVEAILEKAVQDSQVNESIIVERGHSYFETMQPSFIDVKVSEHGIDTEDFLRAVESLLKMFEQFASTAFALVQRIRVRAQAFPAASSTLEQIVLGESRERRKLATGSLLWLNRGLKFTAMAIRRNIDSEREEELSESFTVAWTAEYSKYFNFLIRPFFKILVKACPSRAVFYQKLGAPEDKVKKDLDTWLSSLEGHVARLENFYIAGKQWVFLGLSTPMRLWTLLTQTDHPAPSSATRGFNETSSTFSITSSVVATPSTAALLVSSSIPRSSSIKSGSSTSSSSNTYPLVTLTSAQVVPSSTTSVSNATLDSHSSVAGIAVGAIVGGLAAIFFAYKLYACLYRRRAAKEVTPYPEARLPLAGNMSPILMAQTWGGASEGGRELRPTKSQAFSDASWGGGGNYSPGGGSELDPQFGGRGRLSPAGSSSGAQTPSSPNRRGSPDGYLYASAGGSQSWRSEGGGGSPKGAVDRPYSSTSRRAYGQTYSGPQLRSMPSSNRLTAAPHSAHSRIDIVVPPPLAPPPGSVVATDKSTLDFSPLSGIGASKQYQSQEWFPNTSTSSSTRPRDRNQPY
ncbi:hypothetical protein P7C70_g1947, partial [Phenoliferia sp. Uapishka_3]